MKPERPSPGLCCLTYKRDILGDSALPFPLPRVPFPTSPHGPNKATCVQSPVLCPACSRSLASMCPCPSCMRHTQARQLHWSHGFPKNSSTSLEQPPRYSGCQGKQEVSSWPSHRQQAMQALHWKCAGWGQLFPFSLPSRSTLSHSPSMAPIVLRRQTKPCTTGIASPEPQDLSTLRSVYPSGSFLPQGFCICCSSTWNDFLHLFAWPCPHHHPGPSLVFPPSLGSLPRLSPPQDRSSISLELPLLPVCPPS